MVVGEKFVFYEAYEEVGVARSHFGSHCNTVDLFVVVVTKRKKMVFFTRAHDGLAEDGWDGAVPPSCCTCCLMLGYCVMVEQIASI